MYRDNDSAASRAKYLLRTASQRLHTANPVEQLSDVLEEALPLPVGDRAYSGQRLLEPHFSESTADNLTFHMSAAAPRSSAGERIETAARVMRNLVNMNFGSQALHWLDSRLEPVHGCSRSASWGASFGCGYDRNGMTESLVSVEWGPRLMEALPSGLYRMARIATGLLPGLRPVVSSIRCGRSSGSQQITFEVDAALPLEDLRPLMEELGLGPQHGSLMSAVGFLLGARFTLPPETATLTLRPLRNGVELRLDVFLDALADVPPQLQSLLRLQLGERPRSLRALDRWLRAMTPDSFEHPGDVSVLSVWVRPDTSARVALFLRPSALTPEGATDSNREPELVAEPGSGGAYGQWAGY
jgi:hypothetical protein